MITFGLGLKSPMPPKNARYDPFKWMVVEQSLEEELVLEQTIREIRDCGDIDTITQICAAMVKQQWHQNQLLRQAVNHIAEMDALIAETDWI